MYLSSEEWQNNFEANKQKSNREHLKKKRRAIRQTRSLGVINIPGLLARCARFAQLGYIQRPCDEVHTGPDRVHGPCSKKTVLYVYSV